MKSFMKEFKEFISRGNVMDMAVGIIIGGAFTAIITALVDSIITPLIGVICGGIDFAKWGVQVGEANIMFGALIDAIIKFLLIALVLFSIIKAINKAKDVAGKDEEAPEEPAPVPEDIQLLTEIRDMLKEKK
jgi:large conductance mechanosensitive channel